MSRDKTTTGDLTLLGNKGTKYDDKYNPAVLETFDMTTEQRSIFYYFNRALNIYVTLQDTAGVCQTYKDIGDVYTNMKMFSNA